MTKKPSNITLYHVCYPKTNNIISTFRLCNKHGVEFMKKWEEHGYTVDQEPASKDEVCDICPDKEMI